MYVSSPTVVTSVSKQNVLAVGAGGGTALGVWSGNGRASGVAGKNSDNLELMPLTANPELNYAPSTVSGISG